jgi:hypothetical protein
VAGLKKLLRVTTVAMVLGGFLSAGCAERKEYVSPCVQQQNSPTYKELYPQPFVLDQGPSATSSGDD